VSQGSAIGFAAFFSVLAVGVVVWLALALREGPARCPEGLVREGARCCGQGQLLLGGLCTGRAQGCAQGQDVDASGGCTRRNVRVRVEGELVPLGGAEWEGSASSARKSALRAFEIDSVEVTGARYAECVAAGRCTAISASTSDPPGLPLRHAGPEQARAFCEWAGGRLPSGEEWVLAAAGKEGRRFPWGSTGLVCRRAVFGMAGGACAEDGSAPDPPGSRPDGATPQGVFDLAGNLAEWTRETDGKTRARGGSYLSRGAAELKSWAAEERASPAGDIGFRCVYPAAAGAR
jgi:formylglycine-generating enzyme required for sulfatase activity